MDNTKNEILYIVSHALRELEERHDNSKFDVPNGSIWEHHKVLEYLVKYLKSDEEVIMEEINKRLDMEG